jgi:DNA repair protein RecN (Recombination protein N)
MEQAKATCVELATELSAARRLQSSKFSSEVTSRIRTLGMGHAQFEVTLHSIPHAEPNAYGFEQIEFQISTNPGQPMKPMSKIASGGELSRIALCIQVACTHESEISTLVFDEVDVGIGGATAQIVGHLLRQLGEKNQILCVTHQPQVAAQGHHHLHVDKSVHDQTTRTRIRLLESEAKIHEVARMLGGVELTEQAVAHARELMPASARSSGAQQLPAS